MANPQGRGITSYPFEFRAVRDLQNTLSNQSSHGSMHIPQMPVWHFPRNPLGRMLDVHGYIESITSRIPVQNRISK